MLRPAAVPLLAALILPSCGPRQDPSLAREAVLAELQKEAQSLKADGEKMDPKLGVTATWTVQGVDVQEQPGNETQPWTGAIRFRIDSKTKEWDGTEIPMRFERTFNYAYDATAKRWLMK